MRDRLHFPVCRRAWMVLWALSVAGLLPQTAAGQDWARRMFPIVHHDFGTVARGSKAEIAFEFTNEYEEDIHIASVRSSCGCTQPIIRDRTVKTWETGAIIAAFNTTSFLGQRSATITVVIDKPYRAEVQLTVTGFTRSDVVFHPGVVDFGDVSLGTASEKTVQLAYAGHSGWEIVDVRSANPHFEVELRNERRSAGRYDCELLVRLTPDAPAGYLQESLTVVTNDPRNQLMELPVEGRVVSALSVSPASLFLGVVHPGEQLTKNLIVRGNAPFRITDVICPAGMTIELPDEERRMHVLRVQYSAGTEPGPHTSSLEIVTSLNETLRVECSAHVRGE